MASVDSSQTAIDLTCTRFYHPVLPGDFVDRKRLIDQIDQGLDRPLTLVSAPAGYGKTVLVSSWLNRSNRPVAWLALDENIDELSLFLRHFVTAVQTIDPDALPLTEALLGGFELPLIEVLAGSLINELDSIDGDFVIVLEDYHTIHSQAIHELLAALLHRPLPHMHLVLISRRDPPLPLSVLRARNMIAEVRLKDLQFFADEIEIFMQKVLGFSLPNAAIAGLLRRTEGWIASLRLVALALRYSDDIENQLADLQDVGQNRYVVDYLMSEVFVQASLDMQDFLLRTSILNRLSAPLCSALFDQEKSEVECQSNLELLERDDLFTISLDLERHWYRYHHLLRSFLRSQLKRRTSVEEVAQLHAHASAWFAERDLLEDALSHALRGQDMPTAVQLMAEHRHDLMDTEQWQLHNRALRLFPEEAVAAHPELTIMAAWRSRLGRSDLMYMVELLDRAEGLVALMVDQPEYAVQLRGEIDTLRVMVAVEKADDPERMIELGKQVLATVPRGRYYVRAVAWLWLAVAYQMVGKLDQAYAVLAEGQVEDVAPDGTVRGRVAGSRSFISWMAGDLRAIPPQAGHLRTIAETFRQPESLAWAHLLLCSVAYQHNDLSTAEAHAKALEQMRYVGAPMAYVQSALVYASIWQVYGQFEKAQNKVELAITFLSETRSEGLLPLVQAFQMELAIRQGDLNATEQWATSIGPYVPLTLMPYFYAPQLTLSKIFLAQNTPASRKKAAAELSRLYDYVTANHNTYCTIQVLSMQALLFQVKGDEQSALATLQQAVTLAQPGDFLRLFVDLGPAMAQLLSRLTVMGVTADYVKHILQAFATEPSMTGSVPAASPNGQFGMVEPLSRREEEILALLAQRLTAKEIGHELFISDQTVKRHRANIYQKLGVHSRKQAISSAIALGLLPATV